MNWIILGAINLAVAVALGAFGAHGLKSRVDATQLGWWQTGTEYFFYHALGLLLVGILIRLQLSSSLPAWLLQIGILVFSGSLYAMSLGAPRWLGAVTPIGGTLLILGWLSLAYSTWRLSQLP